METSHKMAISSEIVQTLTSSNTIPSNSVGKEGILSLIVAKAGLVSAGGQVPLINNQTVIIPGISSFDDKPLNKTIIIHGIRMRGNTEDTAVVAKANANFATSTIEAGLANSEFVITQDGDQFVAPIRAIAKAVAPAKVDDDFFKFEKPVTLLPGVPFNFNIKAPVGATAPTAGYFLVEFDAVVVEPASALRRAVCN